MRISVIALLLGSSAAGLAAACGSSTGSTDTTGSGGHASGSGGSSTGSGHGAGTDTTGATGGGFNFDDGGDGSCSPATTCDSAGAKCGDIADGCGGFLHCGDCTAPEVCNPSNQCGPPPCTPKTCLDLNAGCGMNGDGCGNAIDCGTCMLPDTCGGGGTANQCGMTTVCMPKTCADLLFDCGMNGDGCGNLLDCGSCTAPAICGGAGQTSVCGLVPCVPKTCADLGATCGPAADGCGALLQCGSCNQPATCGGGGAASTCGVSALCTNLCLKQVTCPTAGVTTTLSGKVYAPNGVDPLPNVVVYVPNAAVQPFTPGVHCDKCADGVSGSPLVSALTQLDGSFTLSNVPVTTNLPLVIQTGRWRRQVTIPSITACQNNVVSTTLSRLPKNKGEGDIPLMAFATGSVDALECVLRKIGVDDAEFTSPGGNGRIRLYVGSGSGGAHGATPVSETTLWGSQAELNKYDMVLFPCQGSTYTKNAAEQSRLINYANAGGRIFATHYSYVWLFNIAPFSSTATWSTGQGAWDTHTGYIDTSFPKGAALAQWLVNVNASTIPGQIPVNIVRNDFDAVVAPSQSWVEIHDTSVNPNPASIHYTFNTPVGMPTDQQCGRVVFSDFHVEDTAGAGAFQFPGECVAGAMTPQEKLLEFMLFDLGSCITPDVPTCTPTTCAALGQGCGPAGDGCGGTLDCGVCATGQVCSGQPSVCTTPMCPPKTCAQLGVNCGPAGDGCGGLLQCGTCPAGQTCGGGGMSGVCGNQMCTPKTCAQIGVFCGPAGDGCGNLIDCGPCPAGQTCGGGGQSGVCGAPSCTKKTCAQLGANCGPVADGCGGILQCGTCQVPQTCGGGGMANVCGGGGPG